MTIVRRVRVSRGQLPAQRLQQLERELLVARQRHSEVLGAAQAELTACMAARASSTDRILVLERTVQGLRERLEAERSAHVEFLRRHGLGGFVNP